MFTLYLEPTEEESAAKQDATTNQISRQQFILFFRGEVTIVVNCFGQI